MNLDTREKNPNVFASERQNGITLRDYLAGQIIVGLLARDVWSIDGVVEVAYKTADKMLLERLK